MANHVDYVKKLIEVDYIGVARDYDGKEFLVKFMMDASSFPNLLAELKKRGWTAKEFEEI